MVVVRCRLGLEREHLHLVRMTGDGRVHVVTALHVFGHVGLGAETLFAHRTLERLFAGVHALVVQQRCVRAKRFRTVRAPEPLQMTVRRAAAKAVVRGRGSAVLHLYVVFGQPQAVVVHALVLQQVAFGPERFCAHVTNERFFARMHALVVLQRGRRPERFAAKRTLPGDTAATGTISVRGQPRFRTKMFAALFAPERRPLLLPPGVLF